MLPTLKPGQIVIAHGFYRRLRPADIVVVHHDGLEKIKRIAKIENDQIYLLGDNAKESTDSRTLGWLPASVVRAKLIWPHRWH